MATAISLSISAIWKKGINLAQVVDSSTTVANRI